MLLRVQGLSFRYPNSPEILHDIHLDVGRGDFLGIVGPNGSGKSTFLKNLGGYLNPEREKVFYQDKDITRYSRKELALSVASVPQLSPGEFSFTVEEVVLMGRTPHLGRFQQETERDIQVVQEALALTNTHDFKDRYIHELSGGERQRVFIARALAQEPQVLLLDEPTAFLDINFQKEVLNLIQRLNRQKALTVVVILHDLNLAAQYCSRLILLKEGRVFAAGPVEDVISEENIEKVYGTQVCITRNPVSGSPVISLFPTRDGEAGETPKKAHIIGGGGSASALMYRLSSLGFKVTAGVLNHGDTDHATARSLNLEVVEENPFSAISRENHTRNLQVIAASDAVILAEIPIGRGNLLNLEAAREALNQKIPVFLLEEGKRKENKRDYTGGRGEELIKELKKAGAVPVKDAIALQEYLRTLP